MLISGRVRGNLVLELPDDPKLGACWQNHTDGSTSGFLTCPALGRTVKLKMSLRSAAAHKEPEAASNEPPDIAYVVN